MRLGLKPGVFKGRIKLAEFIEKTISDRNEELEILLKI
jgi:hypothetical protein